MKKRFLVVLTLLINLAIVHAQDEFVEEQILGMSVSSLLVVLPIVMILIGLIFFVGLYIKDNYGNLSKLVKAKLKRKKIRGKKEIVIDYPKEVKILQKQVPALEPEESIRKLSILAKKFFAEKFDIDYEYTHGELEAELKKEKESWASFPNRLSKVKFSGEKLTRREVNQLTQEFWDIVKYEKKRAISLPLMEKLRKRRLGFEIDLLTNLKRYLQKAKPRKKEELTTKDVLVYIIRRQKQNLNKILNVFRKVKEDTTSEIKTQVKSIDNIRSKIKGHFSSKVTESRVNDILDLIDKSEKQITQGNILGAKQTYKEAYGQYYKIPVQDQAHIITELQKIQKKIEDYKKPKKVVEEKPIEQIKKFFATKLSEQHLMKVNDMVEDAQKQITRGNIEQAKRIYNHAYKQYYKIPVQEQAHVLSQLRKIQEQIENSEKSIEQLEIEELAKELDKLKSEKDVYVIIDRSEVQKKLDFLTRYIKKLEKQGEYGLRVGKIHLEEKLKELLELTKRTEKEKKKKLSSKEQKYLIKIKEISAFYTKKEEALEKAFKQAQKQIFKQFHNLTKNIRIQIYPKTKKKVIAEIKKPVPKPEIKPKAPPVPPKPIGKKESELLEKTKKLMIYLKKKQKEGLYKLKPAGKDFLNKIEIMINNIKKNEKKGIKKLKNHEKEFLDSLSVLMRKKEGKKASSDEEEKRKLEFLEHMKEEEMIHVKEQKLKQEKERLKIEPQIKIPKVKISPKYLKKLETEERKIIERLKKRQEIEPTIKRVKPKKLDRYEWEIKADEIKKKKTKAMGSLLKEEEDVLSKLNELE